MRIQMVRQKGLCRLLKNLLKKSECGGDPYISLLEYRTTPLAGFGLSLGQPLMGRRLKSKLPTSTTLLTSDGAVQVRRQLSERQMKQEIYYDKQTRTLSDLQPGENVRMQRGATWQPAVVLHKHEQAHSFVIRTADGKQYRRNRKYLRRTEEKAFVSTTEPDI